QGPLSGVQETVVRDVVRERMPEGVLLVGEAARLVEESCGLQMRQLPVQLTLGYVGDLAQQPDVDVSTDHRGALQKALLFERQPIDAGGEQPTNRVSPRAAKAFIRDRGM